MASVNQRTSPPSYRVFIQSIDGGEEKDITLVVNSFNIYSSMDGLVTHGDLNIQETVGTTGSFLIQSVPIVGREVVTIRSLMNIPGNGPGYTRSFYVYAVDSLMVSRDVVQYTVRFTAQQGIVNPAMRICKKYMNQNVNDIMKGIIEEMNLRCQSCGLPGLEYNERGGTKNTITFLVPNWHPLETLSFFGRIACSGTLNVGDSVNTPVSDMVLFPSISDNKLRLRSYHNLFSEPVGVFDLTWLPGSTQSPESGIVEYENMVENVQFNSILDSQAMKMTGIAGSKVYWADFRPNNKFAPQTGLLTAGSEPVTFSKLRELIQKCRPADVKGSTLHSMIYSNDFVHKIIPYNINEDQADRVWENVVYPKYMYGESLHLAMRMKTATFQIRGNEVMDVGDTVRLKCGTGELKFLSDSNWVISDIQHRVQPDSFTTFLTCFAPDNVNDTSFGYTKAELTQIEQAAQEKQETYRYPGGVV